MIINTAKATEAAGILGVELSTLNPDSLTKAYRRLSMEHHPDAARDQYNPETWARISWAKEVLVRWLESRPKVAEAEPEKGDCRACGGSGRIVVAKPRGFNGKPTTVSCVMCNGSGHLAEGGQRAHFGGSE